MATTEGETPRSFAVHDVPKDGENAPGCHPAKLFIGGLPRETSTQQLRDHFSKHGRIVDCVVMRWSDGRSRGFGYITYDNNDSATDALMMTQSLGGRVVDVKRAVPGTNKLFVGGLPQGVTAAELRTYFAGFGPVSDAVVMMDSATGRSRGFGFVCFAPGPEGATAIASAQANYDKNQLRGKWIEVKSAAPPQELSKAADALNEPPMPPPARGHVSMLDTPMGISAMQHHHAAAAAAAAYHAHCMVPGFVPSLPHHFLLPHMLPHTATSMSPDAPDFVPDAPFIQPDYQSLGQAMLWPGGRPPATPQSDRRQMPHLQADLQKGVFSSEQYVEPWPLTMSVSNVMSAGDSAPAPPPGFVSAETENTTSDKKKRTRGRGWTKSNAKRDAHLEVAATLGKSTISPTSLASRPPPGLSLPESPVQFPIMAPELPNMNPDLPVYIEVPQAADAKEMSCQTEGPGCRSCGSAFGCGGQCAWSRNELLGLRQMVQKESTTKTSSHAKGGGEKEKRTMASAGGA